MAHHQKKLTKKTYTKPNQLLLPSIALSALVLMLAGMLALGMNQGSQTQNSVNADSRSQRFLTKGLSVEDLEADLLLLQQDNLEAELSVLGQIQ